MKKIAFFCIPAHGHTNPMLPVAAELVRRGDAVRFYSFDEFEAKIKATGAEFVSCTRFLPEMTKEEEEAVKNISTTEMTIQDIKITIRMNDFLEEEFKTFQPDVVYTDSVCFWGKLNAWKHNVPMVVSTSTFAFNQMSSKYMKQSAAELGDMIFGLPTRPIRSYIPRAISSPIRSASPIIMPLWDPLCSPRCSRTKRRSVRWYTFRWVPSSTNAPISITSASTR